MKKLLTIACIVIAGYSAASAQFVAGEQYLTLSGGYAFGSLKAGGKSIDGGGVNLSFDDRNFGSKPVSLAITFGYAQLEEEPDSVGLAQRTVSTWPLGVGAKAWLGESKVQGYVGTLLTVYFSSLKSSTEATSESYTVATKSGWGLAVPAGVALNISERAFLRVGYELNWLWSNEFVESSLVHMFVAGVGLQIK